MMTDVFKIAEKLVEHVKEKYAEDIALAAYYGSYALGRANAKSDLDFFFIPATDKAYGACVQFILDDIGFDFWPISWERAERMASFEEGMTTIVADSKILYTRSDADLERFLKLREKSVELCKPENKPAMVGKAMGSLKECYTFLYNLRLPSVQNDLTATRMEAVKVIASTLHSLSLLNQTWFTRGWGQNMDQVLALKLKPEGLEQLLEQIMTERSCSKVYSACEELVGRTRELLVAEHKKHARPQAYSEVFPGFFEEAKSTFNKLLTACEKNDYPAAFFAAAGLQKEISFVLPLAEEGLEYNDFYAYNERMRSYSNHKLPDLVGMLEKEGLENVKAPVQELEEKMRMLLQTQGVTLNEFSSPDAWAAFLKNR